MSTMGPQILAVSFGSASKEKDSILTYNDVDLDIIQNLGADYDEAHDKWTYQGDSDAPRHC